MKQLIIILVLVSMFLFLGKIYTEQGSENNSKKEMTNDGVQYDLNQVKNESGQIIIINTGVVSQVFTGNLNVSGAVDRLNFNECEALNHSGSELECKNAIKEIHKKINTGDVTACNALTNKEFCMKLFYFSVALKKRDIQLCDKLSLKEDKENCIKTISDGMIYKEKE